MSTHVDLIATITANPGGEDTLAGLLADYGRVVTAEPGNQRFEVYQERDEPQRFVIIERYVDEDAFQAHLGAPENAAFNASIVDLVAGGGSSLVFLSRSAPDMRPA